MLCICPGRPSGQHRQLSSLRTLFRRRINPLPFQRRWNRRFIVVPRFSRGYSDTGLSVQIPHANSGSADRFGIDPHNYTSGRWLRRDAAERKARFINFDFDALCGRVTELCPGARSVVSCEKKEGGFNRVFIFHTDNDKRLVAKLPFSVAGPPRLTVGSEVATVRYLQSKTNIPIPKVLDWSDDPFGVIGSEYIIMEHAHGIPLNERWESMEVKEQLKCIYAIYKQLEGIVDLQFPGYGSLYFSDSKLIEAQNLPLDEEFAIGPHCATIYWDCNVGHHQYFHDVLPNRGPWPSFASYCNALIDAGISRIPPNANAVKRPRFHGSIQAHRELLKYGRAVIDKMSEDPRIRKAAMPTAFHPDLCKRNIFVSEDDPASITAIIDWQSTSIEPAFVYADVRPDFAQLIPNPNPSLEKQFEPRSEEWAKMYDLSTRYRVPRLAGPRLMDGALLRPFCYCYRTWSDGAVVFRDDLFYISRHWEELGLEGSCPYVLPDTHELAVHQEEFEQYKGAQELRDAVADKLNTRSDGWVHLEDWEMTVSAHKELYAIVAAGVLEDPGPAQDEFIMTEEDLRKIWPFDLEE